jgi:hypothetical protein
VPTGICHAHFDNGETLVPHTFRISRRPDHTVVMHYKEFSADELWLPAKLVDGVMKTDPEGVVIFRADTPPPDPMNDPPP